MATAKTYFARQSYRFLSSGQLNHFPLVAKSGFELDESNMFNVSATHLESPEFQVKPAPNSGVTKRKASKRVDPTGATPSLLSVNIPDWSKILKNEYRNNRRREGKDEDHCVDSGDWLKGGVRIPPHGFLARQMARTRIASSSVHEGIGRNLKGTDLRRVRNAIWEKIGFQD